MLTSIDRVAKKKPRQIARWVHEDLLRGDVAAGAFHQSSFQRVRYKENGKQQMYFFAYGPPIGLLAETRESDAFFSNSFTVVLVLARFLSNILYIFCKHLIRGE